MKYLIIYSEHETFIFKKKKDYLPEDDFTFYKEFLTKTHGECWVCVGAIKRRWRRVGKTEIKKISTIPHPRFPIIKTHVTEEQLKDLFRCPVYSLIM